MPAVSPPPVRIARVAAGWAAAVTAVAVAGGIGSESLQRLVPGPGQALVAAVGYGVRAGVDGPVRADRDRGDARGARRPGARRRLVTGLFAANLVLNLAWTWIFFRGHAARAAGVEILVLLATIVALVRLIWPHNRAAALALAPYGAWVAFATALTWTIAARN